MLCEGHYVLDIRSLIKDLQRISIFMLCSNMSPGPIVNPNRLARIEHQQSFGGDPVQRVVKRTEAHRSFAAPAPACPVYPRPQQYTSPASEIAMLCRQPAEIWTMGSGRPFILTGRLASSTFPIPNWPNYSTSSSTACHGLSSEHWLGA